MAINTVSTSAKGTRHRWTLLDDRGSVVADAADDVRSSAAAAVAAFEELRPELVTATVEERTGSARAGPASFFIERLGARWGWAVFSRQGRVGQSTVRYDTLDAARAAVEDVRLFASTGSAPPAPQRTPRRPRIGPAVRAGSSIFSTPSVPPTPTPPLPIPDLPDLEPFEFEVRTTPPRWGEPIELAATKGTFGAQQGRGSVSLHPPAGDLEVMQWSATTVVVRLPPKPNPALLAYSVVVQRDSGAPNQAPLVFPAPAVDPAPILQGILDQLRLVPGDTNLVPPLLRLPLNLYGMSGWHQTPLGNLVQARFDWQITDENGKAVTEPPVMRATTAPGDLPSGSGEVFAFAPHFVRYGETRPLMRTITLTVTLWVSGVTLSKRFDTVTVTVHAMPIPTLLGMFDKPHFREYVMLVTPYGPGNADEVRALVNVVASALDVLREFGTLSSLQHLAGTAAQLAEISRAIGTARQIHFAQSALVAELNKFEFAPFYTAEDTCSSYFLLGLPGDFVTLSATRSMGGGWMFVTLPPGHIVSLVRTLEVMAVAAEPAGSVTTSKGIDLFASSFDNVVSSVSFRPMVFAQGEVLMPVPSR